MHGPQACIYYEYTDKHTGTQACTHVCIFKGIQTHR